MSVTVPPRPTAPPPAATAVAAPSLPRAGVGQRLAGYAIDLAAVVVPGAVAVVLGGWVLGIVLAAEIAVVTVAVEARRGVTLGKLVTRTRATTLGADLAPGLRREAVRAGLLGAAHLAAGLGQIALLATAGRTRAWHDRVAGTDVVSLRPVAPAAAAGAPVAPVPAARHAGASAGPISVPPLPTAPGSAPVWPGNPTAGGSGSGPWRPPELLEVPVSDDSISMRDFRAMRSGLAAGAGRPAGQPRSCRHVRRPARRRRARSRRPPRRRSFPRRPSRPPRPRRRSCPQCPSSRARPPPSPRLRRPSDRARSSRRARRPRRRPRRRRPRLLPSSPRPPPRRRSPPSS
ncbi:hypothetical protein C8046_07565 [Serinibacter arcticus]|uniref:RDD domain-containing protein n=1 Tax=Serinibacter arcticus TaxID=1655435 RepID=A0A2U1ZU63_9MICO|nr:RDD family protein [Serinibacter arcticus]PWD50528.1 hypothetical protein C8046_07565 [Serinibacter arcticus]